MEIGNTLREAREQHNFTLDDIQERTKIQKRYLVAIENNNFDTLPGRFYARAFIREYAQVVGLDVVELLADFDEDNIEYEQKEVVQNSRLKRMKKRNTGGSSRFLSFLPTVIVVLLVIGIVFVAWTLITKTLNDETEDTPGESDHIIRNPGQENGEAGGTNESNEPNESEKTEEEIVEVEPTFEVNEVGTSSVPLSDMTFTFSGEDVEVLFKSSGDSWLGFNGEEETETGVFENTEDYAGAGGISFTADTEDTSFDVSKEKYVYFHVGYTPNLKIYINDVELEYPAESTNQKVRLKLEQIE